MINSLEDVRANIDEIDNEIIRLIAKRQHFVVKASEFKKSEEGVKAPERVEAVIKKAGLKAEEYGANPDIVRAVYRTMIKGFINMEMQEYKKQEYKKQRKEDLKITPSEINCNDHNDRKFALTEFDANKVAILNPCNIVEPIKDMPKIAISCFAKETFDRLLGELGGTVIAHSATANMDIPIYKVRYREKEFALFMSDVGAPSCVAIMEDVYQMGVKTIILFGTCGVLDKSIEDCSVIIPTSAIRDEGTSFHYIPAGYEVLVNEKYRDKFMEILDNLGCRYVVGKTWTTDGIYRETREKVNRRKEQGCICVDMECSAAAAVAKFRNKEVFEFFYAADNLDSENWEKRSLSNEDKLIEKDKIALIAMEFAYHIYC